MARCPTCNMFCGYDDSTEPEIDNLDFDTESGMLSGSVRVVLNSECCGDEVKEAYLEVEEDYSADLESFRKDSKIPSDTLIDVDLELASQVTTRQQTTDRHGKKIRNPRYMRTYYGYDISGIIRLFAEVKGKTVTHEIDVSLNDDEQASGFDEMY